MEKINGKWVIGVSGGSDSMALLDMCRESEIEVIVAHVNYHKRATALRDEQGVQSYCERYEIPFFKYDVKEYDQTNFQAQARKIRYDFFSQLVVHHACNGVLVAHHHDDVIETYLIQLHRDNVPAYYGLKREATINGVVVKRPLLKMSKSSLLTYCKQRRIAYYEDETNLNDAYLRNKIRHERVARMSKKEKVRIDTEIQQKNVALLEKRIIAKEIYENLKQPFEVKEILSLAKDEQLEFLRYWLIQDMPEGNISLKQLEELSRKMEVAHAWTMPFANSYEVQHAYGVLTLGKTQTQEYQYVIRSVLELQTPYFTLRSFGREIDGFYADASEFPLTIRNFHAGDKICLRFGTKKIARFFIDNKIPREERKHWPVVVNNMGKVIFVYGIGCDIKHYSNNFNMFVVK